MLNKSVFEKHLVNDLIPFWNALCDRENGGFYGSVSSANIVDKSAPKSAVLQTRILWFYSACYKKLGNAELLEYADHQFKFLTEHMIDSADGGVRWMVNADGSINRSEKHTYAQAFTLYALSCYYSASGNKSALECANRLFNLIETEYKDAYGYVEQFNLDRLSDTKTRTMNTLLHVIEAYTEYYAAAKTPQAKSALRYSIELAGDKAYNPQLHRIECNFGDVMQPVGDMLSYGHDIEASWLIDRGCEVLGCDELTASMAPKLRDVALNVIQKGFIDEGRGGIYYDCKDGIDNKLREWWVMAEAIVALSHQYQLYGEPEMLVLAENIWAFTEDRLISPYGEWYWGTDESGDSVRSKSGLVGPWKCPYHNGRMCLEMMERLQ